MPAEVWVALIAAVASLVVALVTAVAAWRTQRRLVELQHRLDEQRSERDARRDYEYEARKRLYAECEPVIFEAMELAETFRRRVVSLARAASRGDVNPDGSGWLAGNDYYFRSTAYYLLAPATSVKLLRRRLTAVDLALEPRIAFQYHLLKEIFHAYTWDHDLAAAPPSLLYTPDAPAAASAPADPRHRRQGFYLGVLDQLADALTVHVDDTYRCRSLGEFWAEIDQANTPVGALQDDVTALLSGFHPARVPVLWRVLVCQYLLMGALLRTREVPADGRYDPAVLVPPPDDALAEGLDWRPAGDPTGLDEVRLPLVVGHDVVVRRLAYLIEQSRS